ncbi:very long chain fatty acid elongase 6-like [Diadema antillarum]|uniref:very long chain fatty acid elongase 6-like n=1 Tax=Diadema antillarum TaxID=105358 RepID=UPI003A8A4933
MSTLTVEPVDASTRLNKNYSTVFEFEKSFNYKEQITWFENNWTLSFTCCAVYVVVIFGLQTWMQNRPRYNLQYALTAWSLMLAMFSWICALRLIADCYFFVSQYGWKASMCDPVFYKGVSGFWCWLFVLSKLPELGDTIFIVLRKQRLIFLHWYHHITVLLYSWYSYSHYIAPGRYFILINACVHAIMYTYYAIRASKIARIPSWINISITSIQIIQMIVGCWVNIYAYMLLRRGEHCSTTQDNIKYASLMYFSYFMLFAHFFYKTYINRDMPKKIHKE